MFGKLIKYEWKAVMRSMLPIYGALAAISVINAFLFSDLLTGNGAAAINLEQGFLDQTQMVAMLLYTGILVVMGVFTVMIVIRRFYSGLLKREGYLMFTLPVKPWQLVLSKALVACVVCMLSFLVAFFSIGCYAGGDFFVALIEIPRELLDLFIRSFVNDAVLTVNGTLMVIEVLALGLVAFLGCIVHFYLAMALGQLAKHHKVAFSVVAYVVLGTVMNFINLHYCTHAYRLMSILLDGNDSYAAMHLILWIPFVSIILELAVGFIGTSYILDRKLNLE